jgi:uncharacterized protein
MSDSPHWSVLEPASCVSLLSAGRFGRLAVVAHDRPMIVVLNYVPLGTDLLLRTGDGTRLAALIPTDEALPAEFEVDSTVATDRSGWSVIAHGEIVRERDPVNLSRALAELRPWAGDHRDLVLRLRVESTTGRRVGAAD